MTCWSNWAPRLGVAYDVFATGKTAVKASFGKYMRAESSAFATLFNPVASFNENRNWSDPNGGGLPTSILQPRIIRLGAQLRF